MVKFLNVMANIIFLIGVIGGIVLGKVFKMIDPKYLQKMNDLPMMYKYDKSELVFNYPLMLYIWVGCFLTGIVFLAISEFLLNQEIIIDGQQKILKNLVEIKETKANIN